MVSTGNFGALGTTIYNPFSTTTSATGATTRVPFAANTIPGSLLAPQAAKLMSLLPAPTTSGAVNNFTYTPSGTQTLDQVDFRVDENLNEKNRLFAKYSFDRAVQLTPGRMPAPANSPIPVGPYIDSNGNTSISPRPHDQISPPPSTTSECLARRQSTTCRSAS